MEHFFGCSACSSHFLKMAESIDGHVKSARDAVLWLWQAHNEVNKRLAGDDSEDPAHRKVPFPPKPLCPDCQISESQDGKIKWDKDKVLAFLLQFYGKENIVEITEQSKYSDKENLKKDRKDLDWWERKQREKDLEKIRDLRKKKRDILEEKKKSLVKVDIGSDKKSKRKSVKKEIMMPPEGRGWISHTDMGVCAMFYLLCLVIILAMYYHFTIRRKNNLFKHCPKIS